MSKRSLNNTLEYSFAALVILTFFFANSVMGQGKKEKEEYVWKTVSGKVVDAEGQPVKDAFVCHCNIKRHPMNHTSTNEKGEFELKYREFKSALEKGRLWAYSPDHNFRCVMNIRTNDHLLELPKLTEFKITFSQPDGEPLKNAIIQPYRCYVPNGKYSDAISRPRLGGIIPDVLGKKLATKTDENGQCVIRSIPRELWGRVIIESENHGKHILGGGTSKDSFKLAETGSLKIEILPDEPIEFAGTEVSLTGYGEGGETFLTGKIGGMGICKFDHVAPGEIKIRMKIGKDEIYQPKLEKNYTIDSGFENHIKIRIKETVVIQGKVMAKKKPVPNAKLVLADSRTIFRTDEKGEYRTRVFPGNIKIDVYDMPRQFYKDFETGSYNSFSVKASERPVTLDDIEIPALTPVRVSVVDENDKPVTGFKVHSVYEPLGYGPLYTPELDKQGNAIAKLARRDLGNLDEGSYFLIQPKNEGEKSNQEEEPKKIKLSIDSDALALAGTDETLVFRCKRADIKSAQKSKQSGKSSDAANSK